MNFNILGIGLPQLILVFGLSMMLFGPKKMIQYAYQAGRWISQLRMMWEEAAKNVQKEFHEAGLDLPTDLPMRGGRIDIGAAAMRIVEQSSTPPNPANNPATVVEPIPASSNEPSATLSYPTDHPADESPAPSPVTPEPDPTVEQGKKYNAWLPD